MGNIHSCAGSERVCREQAVVVLKRGGSVQNRHNTALHVLAGGRLALAWPGVFVYYHGSSLDFCSLNKAPGIEKCEAPGT